MPVILKVLLLAVVLAGQAFAGITTNTWTGLAGNGLWSDPGNWDQGFVPGNGPFGIPDVVIPAGVLNVVTLDIDTSAATFPINHVSIGSGATLILAPGGNLGAPVVVLDQDAVIRLTGGSISNADVQANGVVTATIIAFNPGTNLNGLNSVAIESGITLDISQDAGAFCSIQGGLTVNGTVKLGNASGSNAGSLFAQGGQTIGGSGTIAFGANPQNGITETFGGDTLTIGDGSGALTINGINGTIYANGIGEGSSTLFVSPEATISSDGGGTITLQVANWDVEGTVQAVNGAAGASSLILSATGNGNFGGSNSLALMLADSFSTLSIGGTGSWQNSISQIGNPPNAGIKATNGATLVLGGSWRAVNNSDNATVFASASSVYLGGSFLATDADGFLADPNQAASSFYITGTMDNTPGDNSQSFTLNDGGSQTSNRLWYLAGGTINGGTILGPFVEGTSFENPFDTLTGTDLGGTLSGVTLDSTAFIDLSRLTGVGSQALATVVGGITINGTLFLGDTSGFPAGIISWSDTQTWGGSGFVTFRDNFSNAINQSSGTPDATLTIGPSLTINGHQGAITANVGTSTLINQGTIDSQGDFTDSNQSITLYVHNWINLGSLIAESGSSLVINGTGTGANDSAVVFQGGEPIAISGLIRTSGGTITIFGTQTNLPWVNSVPNGVQISNGGTLNLGDWSDATSGGNGFALTGNSTLQITGQGASPSATTAQVLAILAVNPGISTVSIAGFLDNSGANATTSILDLGTGPTWILNANGSINGGTISQGSAGSATLLVQGSNAQLFGPLTIDTGATLSIASPFGQPAASCAVFGGMALNGKVVIDGTLAPSTLAWNGTQTWGGSGTISFLGSEGTIADQSSPNETPPFLILGDGNGLSVLGQFGSGTITTHAADQLSLAFDTTVEASLRQILTFSGGSVLDNQGTMTALGGSIIFSGINQVVNDGAGSDATMEAVNNGGFLTFTNTSLTNSGTLVADGGGAITGSSPAGALNNSLFIDIGKVTDDVPSSLVLTFSALSNSGSITTQAGSSASWTVGSWTNTSDGAVTVSASSDSLSLITSESGSNDGNIASIGSLTITGGSWMNNGSITTTNGSLYLGGSWGSSSDASITDSDSIVYLGGSFISDEFSRITVNNGSGTCAFHLCGTMDGTAGRNPFGVGVLDLSLQTTSSPSNAPAWLLDGGTLLNATLTDTSLAGLSLVVTTDGPPSQLGAQNLTVYGNNPGTLDGVIVGQSSDDTVLLDLATNNGATCMVATRLTVNTSIQVGGPEIIEDSSTGSLVWVGSQSWGGLGTINLGFVSANSINDGNGNNANRILTIAAPLTINAGQGSIIATSPNAQLVNNGTITTNSNLGSGLGPIDGSGMTIQLGGNNYFTNGPGGTLTIEPGTSILVQGNCIQTGTLTVAIGTPNSPPAVPTTQTINALNVTGSADTSSGTIVVNAVPGYPPAGGPTNAAFTVLTAINGEDGVFSGHAPGAGIPGNFQQSEDAAKRVISVQIVQPSVGIALANGQSAATNAAPISFQVTSPEAIYIPDPSALAVTGGVITGILPADAGSAAASFTVTIAPSGPGSVALSIPAGAALDTFGVPALASNAATVIFDSTPIIATIAPNGTSTNSTNIQFTLSFSKPLSGPPTVSTSGGPPAVITGSASPNLYLATVTAAGSGSPATPVTVSLATAGAVDMEGNHLAAAVSATVTYDTVAPTVAITPNGTVTNASPIPFTLTFSKPVALTAAGLSTNGTLGALSGGPIVWTVPVTPAPGSVTLTVLGAPSPNAPVDLAGNALAASATATVTSDTTPPALVSFTPSGTTTSTSPIPFTITFTKPVSLNAAAVQVTGGTLAGVSAGPSASYTITVTPNTANPPVLVTVTVPAIAVADLAGNGLAQPAVTSVNFDDAPVTTAITPSGTTQATPPIVFTVTFGKPLASALTLGEVTITNGTAGAVTTVSASVYTIAVTPVAAGAVFLQIAGGVVADAVGNPNQPAIAVVNFSTNAPSVVVTPVSGTSALSPVSFTLTFSTAVSGLTSAGLASNGALGAIAPVGGGGTTYSVAVTPSGFGAVTLQVLAGAAVDSSAHGNTASNVGSIDYTVVTASTPVTVTVAPAAPTANASPVVFTLSFSVPVSGLTLADLVVTNGTAGNLQGSGSSYTVDVTPSGDGPVSVAVLPNVATDSAGTANLASPPATVIYHATPPSAALAFGAGVPVAVASFPLTISFSEPVTGFTIGGLAIANGSASAFSAIDSSNYSVTITPAQPVTASVVASIAAGACQDAFGNANLAATITIPMQSTQLSTGVVTPSIALSPANATVFTAICPGTQGGLAQVQAFLAGASSAQARAFVWDATLQDFVQVPGQSPTGGWQPFQGIFLASRLPTAFDFNGFMTTFDYTITLRPGWNFVGIPPLDDNGTAVTTHLWSDLQLEDASGAVISGAQRVNLIDVGAWGWNGSAYSQVSGALVTGQGYWIDNASSPGVDLVLRRLSPSELLAQLGAFRSSQSGQGGKGSQAAAATIGYKAHGTPPQPPSGSGQGDGPGHGCGLGSGVGALILGLSLLLRLRLRSRR